MRKSYAKYQNIKSSTAQHCWTCNHRYDFFLEETSLKVPFYTWFDIWGLIASQRTRFLCVMIPLVPFTFLKLENHSFNFIFIFLSVYPQFLLLLLFAFSHFSHNMPRIIFWFVVNTFFRISRTFHLRFLCVTGVSDFWLKSIWYFLWPHPFFALYTDEQTCLDFRENHLRSNYHFV